MGEINAQTPSAKPQAGTVVDVAQQVTAPADAAKGPLGKLMGAKTPSQAQNGWWKVAGVNGAKGAVSQKLTQIPGIHPHWQAALQAEIAAHDAAAVTVHAHYIQQNRPASAATGGKPTKGKVLLVIDISPVDEFVQ